MKFGLVPLAEAEGASLAHSQLAADGPIRKGTVLDMGHLARLEAAGVTEITVARLDPDDIAENDAAHKIGLRLVTPGLTLTPAFTGRANLVAETPGVLRIDATAIARMNAVDEGLTLATLPDLARVAAGQMVATVKVIPYGIGGKNVQQAAEALDSNAIRLHPFQVGKAQLILTKTPDFKEQLLTKGERIVRERIETLGFSLTETRTVAHDEQAVAAALDPGVDLILILGASATSDRADVAPAAVLRAGGRIDRFGMPVDPGNLLFLGDHNGTPVVGLPGCARSPALNGVDWVLERIAAGIPVDSAAIAAMGVGGLLKEMPGRPQPRQPKPR